MSRRGENPEGTFLADSIGPAREAAERRAAEVPVLHADDLREHAAEPQVRERLARVRAIAAGEDVDPPHRIRRVDSTGEPGIDNQSETRDV